MTSSDRNLDKVLAGKTAPDEETQEMVDAARRLEEMLAVEAPPAPATRALFTTAVATRRRPSAWRFMAPAITVTSLLVAVYFAGRAATPGEPLWGVRQVLQQVDLAPATFEEVDDQLSEATRTIVEAETIAEDNPRRARILATRALKTLGVAESLARDLPSGDSVVQRDAIERLEKRALAVLFLSFEEEEPEGIEERADELEDDDSGSGSDDSGSDDGDFDDSSGSGSGSDDSGSDDNSGSGSGSDDDNSGSGADDSDSSGSGSGSDDNSGPG